MQTRRNINTTTVLLVILLIFPNSVHGDVLSSSKFQKCVADAEEDVRMTGLFPHECHEYTFPTLMP